MQGVGATGYGDGFSVGVEEKAVETLPWSTRGKIYELKYEGQEGGMALGMSVTCNMFDFGYVALEWSLRQPQQVLGIMQ